MRTNKQLVHIGAGYWDDLLTMQGKVKLLHSWDMQHGLCTRKFDQLPSVLQVKIMDYCDRLLSPDAKEERSDETDRPGN